jgi:cytochrome P450
VVHAFARELPAQAICLVLGVPETDRPVLLDQLDAGIEDDSPSILSAEAMAFIRTYATDLIARKRAEPDGGIMSTIIAARHDDGTQLTDRELVSFFALLLPAGGETTRSAIAGAVLAFVEHPEQYQRLGQDPTLVPTAVEEVIRWTTPSIYKRRTASRDTTLAGQPIAAGDKVTFWELSANRDERAFVEPFRFDVARHPNPHLGFGWGVHFCLGASLARLELRIALEALVARYRSFDRVGDHEWMPNNRLLGLKRLCVRPVPV